MTDYWYLATPYSKYPAGIEKAFQHASEAAAHVIRQDGRRVYCPIAHTHPIAVYGHMDPYDHEIWLPQDRPFMDNAAGLIVVKMPGWEESFGIGVEIEEFRKAGKPIEYMEWPVEGN